MKKIRRSKKQSEETIFCTVLIKITLALWEDQRVLTVIHQEKLAIRIKRTITMRTVMIRMPVSKLPLLQLNNKIKLRTHQIWTTSRVN
jgi:hypothetical protein